MFVITDDDCISVFTLSGKDELGFTFILFVLDKFAKYAYAQ